MSVTAMAWAWKRPGLTSTEVLVLLALADHADDEGLCWPGQRGVAEKARMARPTVNVIIRRLQDKGALTVIQRTDRDGRKLANRYRLAIAETGGACQPALHTMSGSMTSDVSEDDISYQESSREPSEEPSRRESVPNGAAPTDLENKLRLSLTAIREKKPRASRIPEDFALTDERAAYARANGVTGIQVEFERFTDYWRAKAGKDAVKQDWDACWRNWCRKAAEYAPARAAPSPASRDEPYFGNGEMAHLARRLGLTDESRRDPKFVGAGQGELVPAANGRPNSSGVGTAIERPFPRRL